MNWYAFVPLAVLSLVNLALLIFLVARRRVSLDAELLRPQFEAALAETRRLDVSLREEFTRQREESGRASAGLREEVSKGIKSGMESLLTRQAEAQRAVETRLESFRVTLEGTLRGFGESSDARLSRLRQELNDSATQARSEMGQALDKIRATVETKLNELQSRNEQKLEEMRKTVDEKLEGTLERRLGESFKLVSERLEQVHKGLGEMQVMANSVGDLKRVLSNVKTRGIWGEIQLGALLEQILTRDQYMANVTVKPGSNERVEFAIRLPGRTNADSPVWLPIDAKFPQEDYQRLMDAAEIGDAEAVAQAAKALEVRLRGQARTIREKYVVPPHTTDFGILFLPSEGLYAEVLRRPGLAEALQRESRVTIAGPTTLAALLNSLQMGFRTLAIERRSSEVWQVLGAVKSEFGKFGEVLAKVKKKIDEASSQIEQTEVRTRVISKKLREVEGLPPEEAARLLPESVVMDDEPVERATEEEPGSLKRPTAQARFELRPEDTDGPGL